MPPRAARAVKYSCPPPSPTQARRHTVWLKLATMLLGLKLRAPAAACLGPLERFPDVNRAMRDGKFAHSTRYQQRL